MPINQRNAGRRKEPASCHRKIKYFTIPPESISPELIRNKYESDEGAVFKIPRKANVRGSNGRNE